MIRVRCYTDADLPAVLAVFQGSVHAIAGRDYTPAQTAAWAPDPPDRAAWAERLTGGGVFVAEYNGRIAGFARIDDCGRVDLLYVDPAHQRRGVGRALLQRVTAWGVTRGRQLLTAEVSITARPFFERAGFRVIGPQTVERRGVRLQNFRMEAHLGTNEPPDRAQQNPL